MHGDYAPLVSSHEDDTAMDTGGAGAADPCFGSIFPPPLIRLPANALHLTDQMRFITSHLWCALGAPACLPRRFAVANVLTLGRPKSGGKKFGRPAKLARSKPSTPFAGSMWAACLSLCLHYESSFFNLCQ